MVDVFALAVFNTVWLEHTSPSLRMAITTLLFAAGLVGVAFSPEVNFMFLLVSVVLVGSATSFGQQIILGQLASFEPTSVGGWSAGTGVAGIAGSLTMIGFAAADFTILQSFLFILPTVALYALAYFVMLVPPPVPLDMTAPAARQGDAEAAPLLGSGAINATSRTAGSGETGLARLMRCTRLTAWLSFNLCVVYFAEYVVSVGCADLAEPRGGVSKHDNFFKTHTYVVLAFCYQLGVFISRSSLGLFKVSRIEVLSLLQMANMVFWMLDDVYKWMPYYWQFVAMIYCGLLGGTSYVNTFYLLNIAPYIPEFDRKLCIYIVATFTNLGICAAAAFVLLMDGTFMAAYVPGKSSGD